MMLVNQIPNKSLFKMQEVCDICQIKPYVLRFWDSEFDQINSVVNSAGKKLYQKKDILVISVLKDLLFDRKLTIEKARLELSEVDFDTIIESQMQTEVEELQESLEGHLDSLESVTKDNLSESKANVAVINADLENRKTLKNTSEQLKLVLERIEDLKCRYNWT